MAFLGPLFFTLCALAAILSALTLRTRMRAAFASVDAELARRGIRPRALDLQGAPSATPPLLDEPQRGILLERADGIRASMTWRGVQGAPLPGFSPTSSQHALVELPLALPDHMICAHDHAQAAFGPFPPTPLRTSSQAFDQRFGVYARADDATGYRSQPPDATPWSRAPAAPAIFANLETLGFVAMHVHGGRGRMLFAPQSVDGLVSAMDTAAMIARPHEPRHPARRPSPARTAQAFVMVYMLVAFMPMTVALALTSSVTEAGLEIAGHGIACPNGGTFKRRLKNTPARCILADRTSYSADESAYKAWQWALYGPCAIAIAGLGAAIYIKKRRDAARVIAQSLAS